MKSLYARIDKFLNDVSKKEHMKQKDSNMRIGLQVTSN